ncbi:tubulin polyglutamylase TTLL4 [Biomphalaria glabrata]|nr:tubulin polyglutamylase TTLL4-like [Biomphalaria glabrata]
MLYRLLLKFSRTRCRSQRHLFYIIAFVIVLAVVIAVVNFNQLQCLRIQNDFFVDKKEKRSPYLPTAWIQGSLSSKNNDPNGYLKNVYSVFQQIGFTFGDKSSDWLVMWSHDYPFEHWHEDMVKLKPNQRVNHFPGSGYITNKVNLAQSKFTFIPISFELPLKRAEFINFATQNKNIQWVQKGSKHRGIQIKKYEDIDLNTNGTFVQEYVSNPFLVDGRKFDIGIYTVITAIDPLRVYCIDGEALFRFCPQEYYPFNASILDKYVVADEYLPLWKIPSLKKFYSNQGLTFKNAFNSYLLQHGENPEIVWNKMYNAIQKVILMKEQDIIQLVKHYPSKRNFFEMMRFDFVLDENLNIYLMEANMSPNLSSDHFKENARLYKHVIFNLLNLVGISHFPRTFLLNLKDKLSLHVSARDIQVFPRLCLRLVCISNCSQIACRLCKHCLNQDLMTDLKIAYLEHLHRGTAKRIFPPTILQSMAYTWTPEATWPVLMHLNVKNQLIYMWFIGKCQQDIGWCN